MRWIIQEDLYSDNKRDALLSALIRLDIDFTLVKVADNKTDPEIVAAPGELIITNGSIMLSNIARAKGWAPGSFLNDNFTYAEWAKRYSDFILNKSAAVCALKDASITADKVFARPILDNKTFNGRVFERDEFLAFQRASLEGAPGSASPDTQILISTPKKIGQEHRHYIVDGEVVTSSRYKFAGQPNFREGADDAVLEVVKKAIALWTPARAFVMDTYIAGDEIGVVEIGCVCHAGLYDSDVIKLVSALDSMSMSMSAPLSLKRKAGPV